MDGEIVISTATSPPSAELVAFYAGIVGYTPSAEGSLFDLGKVATVGSEIVGVMVGSFHTEGDGSGRQLFTPLGAVGKSWRRRGIGRRLLDSVVEECRAAHEAFSVVVSVGDESDPSVAPFLAKNGFTREPDMLRLERDVPDTAPSEEEKALTERIYRGGDPAMDAAIVELYARAYRHRRRIPLLTVDILREQFATSQCAYVLILEGEQLVAHSTVHFRETEYFVDSVLIARSHWGSAVAGILGRAMIRHAVADGFKKIGGMAEETNVASRRFQERHGLVVVGRRQIYSLNVGGV